MTVLTPFIVLIERRRLKQKLGWLMASLLFIFGRIGFTGANVFYDALLPHVATPEDQDRVSTRPSTRHSFTTALPIEPISPRPVWLHSKSSKNARTGCMP